MEKIIIIILFGLAWGSFLNVAIYRLPRNLSLISPPSSCPNCGKRIKIYQNIPIISYIVLGGKCRYCHQNISFSYPLVEILTPLSFILLYSRYSLSFFFAASCVFISAMLVLAFIDYYHQILPDLITIPGFILSFLYSVFRTDLSPIQSLIGAAVGGGSLLLIYGVYYILRKKEGLGLGDVLLMLFIGAYLGWLQVVFVLILASFAGTFVAIFIIIFKKKNLQHALPFGTFLSPSAIIALIWGETIINAYLSHFNISI
jgi:leader peptidase (prepilin peptidase)/N-methyltransferase